MVPGLLGLVERHEAATQGKMARPRGQPTQPSHVLLNLVHMIANLKAVLLRS